MKIIMHLLFTCPEKFIKKTRENTWNISIFFIFMWLILFVHRMCKCIFLPCKYEMSAIFLILALCLSSITTMLAMFHRWLNDIFWYVTGSARSYNINRGTFTILRTNAQLEVNETIKNKNVSFQTWSNIQIDHGPPILFISYIPGWRFT